MPRRLLPFIAMLSLAGITAAPLAGQVSTPLGQIPVPRVGGALGDLANQATETLGQTSSLAQRQARSLLRARDQRLDRLLRAHRDRIERDAAGNLARRGELLVTGVDGQSLPVLEKAGFRVIASETIEGLDIALVRLQVPLAMSLAKAETLASRLAPDADISADTLHFQTGVEGWSAASVGLSLLQNASGSAIATPVGMIDSAPGAATKVTATKGFASGALAPSDHGSAIASLLQGEGVQRIWAADIYGTDPAGGNALSVGRALGWLVTSGCKVITISLVGPRNAVVERAVASAQARGVIVVAAVGNDGPAAPPAYPASYDGVLAITGVDRKGRALIEAGRALHLDYAAPGADVYARNAGGKLVRWRGTSFATPLAASRVAAALQQGSGQQGSGQEGKGWRAKLDSEARDLGPKGPDKTYGRGLLCEGCAAKN